MQQNAIDHLLWNNKISRQGAMKEDLRQLLIPLVAVVN